MFAEPARFDRDELARIISTEWDIEVARLSYVPVGFGTHHYRMDGIAGSRWFVNVDRLTDKTWLGGTDDEVVDALERALGTAAALREAGLAFVHGPTRRTDGRCVARMGAYAVSVFGFLDGTGQPYGEFADTTLRRRVLWSLGRMHGATHALRPADLPRRDSVRIPSRALFDVALAELDEPWSGGPYAESARQLIRARTGRIDEMFARYDELVPCVLSTVDDWVVTHGEPHAGNVMTAGGGIALIDWDTVALAPRERDLWMIEPRDAPDWTAYGAAGGVDTSALELYRLWWSLSEICGYTTEFRSAHVDDENARVAWRSLRGYLDT
jgi:spectinomycin phosphotransferase